MEKTRRDAHRHMSTFHTPVLMKEVIEGLQVRAGKNYIDATIGGGGYGVEIVKRGGRLLGIDQDPDAIEYSAARIKLQAPTITWGADITIAKGNFRDIQQIAKANNFTSVDGVLFDLGVSSHQLDTPSRGFSFRRPEALLDLRMNPKQGIPAWELVKKLSEDALYEIFAAYGEEKFARTIAGSLVRARRLTQIRATGDLLRVIDTAVGRQKDKTGIYARIFQALRIAVNDELEALKGGLQGALGILRSQGRLVVISYHSLEDRIVKRVLNRPDIRIVNKRPITPGDEEIYINSRSRSAKLRIAEKL